LTAVVVIVVVIVVVVIVIHAGVTAVVFVVVVFVATWMGENRMGWRFENGGRYMEGGGDTRKLGLGRG